MSVEQPEVRSWSGIIARGVVGGILAGALFLAANMWFATSVGDPAKGPLLMMSTILKGDEAMMAGTASVAVGLAVHVVLSAAFGAVFAALASRLRTAGAIAAAGMAHGAVLYLLNFKVLSPVLFTTFEMANQPFELVVHVAFGALLSLALLVHAPNPAPAGADRARLSSPARASV